MTHAGGKMLERRLLGRIVLVDDHEPWRYYYRCRNFIIILCSYFWLEPWWSLKALVNFVKMIVKISLYETNRLAKFAAIARGVRDGCSWRITALESDGELPK